MTHHDLRCTRDSIRLYFDPIRRSWLTHRLGKPASDPVVDLDSAEQVEMPHPESNPLSRWRQPQVQRTVLIAPQGTANRHEAVAAHSCAARSRPRLPARRDRVAA